jgi:hypothetical protein
VTGTFTSSDTNYASGTAAGTLKIDAATPTLSLTCAEVAYDGNPHSCTGSAKGVSGAAVNGTWSFSPSSAAATGSVSVTGTFTSSDTNYASGTAAGTLTITPASTAATETTSLSVVTIGSSVTFTAIVTSPTGIVPQGTVTFTDGTTTLGAATLDSSGTATLTTAALAAGAHTIVATYSGSSNFASSTASVISTEVNAGSLSIVASPAYQEVQGGGQATYTVAINSQGGFAGPVDLTCAGLPPGATCSFSQNPVTLTAGGTVQVTMTVTTTTADAAVRKPRLGSGNLLVFGVFAPFNLSGFAALLAGCFKGKRRPTDGRLIRVLCILAIVFLVIGLSGCGCPSTQHQTYTISITSTSAGPGTPFTTSTSVALIVK